MGIDLSKCRVCSPAGEQLRSMQRILWELFPYDRPVYDELMKTGDPFYTLGNFALYCDDEFLGNVGLIRLKVWLGGRITEIIGVGAVATVPQYRRMGVAKHLMTHCMKTVDEQQLPAALYTELPIVYEEHGFKTTPQFYPAADLDTVKFDAGCTCQLIPQLDNALLAAMAEVYDNVYPAYDGKVVRDAKYWQLYRMFYNPYPKPKIVFCRSRSGELQGYARFEVEEDRFAITELCTSKEAPDVAESLLAFIQRCARDKGIKLFTIALPPEHFVFTMLRSRGMTFFGEPEGVRREIFMVRQGKSNVYGFDKILWSLADKF
jgi:predicted acetyltransferase